MDLSTLEPVEGTTIPVLHPIHKTPLKDDKTGEPITVDIVGQDSEQYREFVEAVDAWSDLAREEAA